ncbi:2-oxoacid:ferredoxin oxidoreductase subunit alpha [Desulfosporosinus sp. SB140]|uniref:2-oxoacid:ferredoxin oxidoreductase subunit alpha n=1 Tax=Desulfosporosinus paludis TaxID=3115649 RepID=UPI00388DBBB2
MAVKNLPVVPSGDPGALGAAANYETWRIVRPEITEPAKVNPIVTLYCPEGAIMLEESGVTVNYKLCKGCGICAKESKGIQMVPEYTGPKGIF